MSIGDRDSSFASPVGKEMTAISAKQQLTIHWYYQQLTDTPPTVDHNISVKVSAECWLTYRPSVNRWCRPTVYRSTWITCWPILGRLSADSWPICQLICWLIATKMQLLAFDKLIEKPRLTKIIIKFPYNVHSDWLKECALSENRARVDYSKLAFKFLLRNFDKFAKLSIPCDSDKRNGNELFVCSKYGSQRPLLATVVSKLY